MCHNGTAECVYVIDIPKYLTKGWTLGLCTAVSCGTDQTLMCHHGKQECIKTKDLLKKLSEPGQHWQIGACLGNTASKTNLTSAEYPALFKENGSLPHRYSLSSYPNPFADKNIIGMSFHLIAKYR